MVNQDIALVEDASASIREIEHWIDTTVLGLKKTSESDRVFDCPREPENHEAILNNLVWLAVLRLMVLCDTHNIGGLWDAGLLMEDGWDQRIEDWASHICSSICLRVNHLAKATEDDVFALQITHHVLARALDTNQPRLLTDHDLQEILTCVQQGIGRTFLKGEPKKSSQIRSAIERQTCYPANRYKFLVHFLDASISTPPPIIPTYDLPITRNQAFLWLFAAFEVSPNCKL